MRAAHDWWALACAIVPLAAAGGCELLLYQDGYREDCEPLGHGIPPNCVPDPTDGGAGGAGGGPGGGPAQVCSPGDKKVCYDFDAGTPDAGRCKAGKKTCDSDGQWGPCEGEVGPMREDPSKFG